MPKYHPDIILYPDNLDYSKQAVELPGTRRPGQTGIYRNLPFPELIHDGMPDTNKTLHDLFEAGKARVPNGPCLGHRPLLSTNPVKFAPYYVWQTFTEVDERRRNLGSAFELLWKQGRAGGGELPTVGIWSQNRPEWQIVDLAAISFAKVSVSLYDTLGPGAVEFICNHAEVSLACVSAQHLPSLLALVPKLPHLKIIVCLDEPNEQARFIATSWAKHHRLEFFSLKELEAIGKANRIDPIIPTPDQIYSICYTSGTTNNPKGVILRHGQVALATCSALRGTKFSEPGVTISYLPLAHIYGRLVELGALKLGGSIGYFTGDPLRLLEDCQILRPTWFPSVPRVLNRIYQVANATGDVPGLKGDIFRRAVKTKTDNYLATGTLTHPLWDRIVFRKIQRVLGGRIECITTGSAPISQAVVNFLKIAFACEVLEGYELSNVGCFARLTQEVGEHPTHLLTRYGLTETTATCTKTLPGDIHSGGTTGPPQPGAEIMLVDVPEMGYTSLDQPRPRGELCSRGPVNMPAYYKDDKNTASTIDSEGWLHSGDIAEIDSCGRILIIDRIKNMMKLSQGEYVALEKVENAYSALPVIAQIYVHGESLRDHLVAIVVPDPEQFAAMASKVLGLGGSGSGSRQISPADSAALERAARDERVIRALLGELAQQGKKAGLRGFETVKNVYISLDPFTTENDMLTPTLKLKRRIVYAAYKPVIEKLYQQPAKAAKL